MADEAQETPDEEQDTPRRGPGLVVWLIAVVAALVFGGGAFFATYSGMADSLLGGGEAETEVAQQVSDDSPTFLELDPLLVSVGGASSVRQLRFRAFLELDAESGSTVNTLQPRILDIFATYLRAVPVDTLQDPTALLRLRAQLLRRVQLLAGPEAVRDLLIIDFVIT